MRQERTSSPASLDTFMLSPAAEIMITNYLNLPCAGTMNIRCPYVNNSRHRRRGELRALVGKGTPEEIIAEANILSTQYRAGFFSNKTHECLCSEHSAKRHSPEEIRRFLIDHNLGIECSGFVTNVLRAHFKETKQIDIAKKFFIVSPRRLLRYLISRLRPVENIDVTVYANDRNSRVVASNEAGWHYDQLLPGDVVTILKTGPRKTRNHILLITAVTPETIQYAHARAWPSEGEYGHGVARGTIHIKHPLGPIAQQEFSENNSIGTSNETYQEVIGAEVVEVRRVLV